MNSAALRGVTVRGDRWASQMHDALTRRLERLHGVQHRLGLTDRHMQILLLIQEERLNKEIAAILDISHKTVEALRAQMMERLGEKTVIGAVLHLERAKRPACRRRLYASIRKRASPIA